MKHFIAGTEFNHQELAAMIELALDFKHGKKLPDLHGKILTLIFGNPSLRTRLSFESGMKKMNGQVNIIEAANSWQFEYRDGVVMNEGKQEHFEEAARVISRYCDLIGLRPRELMTGASSPTDSHSWAELKQDLAITQLARYATCPVINMESNMFHPCQGMADVMTLKEHFGDLTKKKYVLTWAPHPKALPLATPHSQLLTPAMFGMDVTLVSPEEFPLDPDVISLAKRHAHESGGSVAISHNQHEAFENANIIVAKSWASLHYFGDWNREAECRTKYADWTVTKEKMKLTDRAVFLHCLPVRRNVVVTDEVLDSKESLIINEAENRMWMQMAIINYLLKS